MARIVKRGEGAWAEGLTVEEALARAVSFAGHSLRAGQATSATANDAGPRDQRQLRHARFDTTTRYIRAGHSLRRNSKVT